jgi:hypothetical protein
VIRAFSQERRCAAGFRERFAVSKAAASGTPKSVLLRRCGGTQPTRKPQLAAPEPCEGGSAIRNPQSLEVHPVHNVHIVRQIRQSQVRLSQTPSNLVKPFSNPGHRAKTPAVLAIYCGFSGATPNQWWFTLSADTGTFTKSAIRNPQSAIRNAT